MPPAIKFCGFTNQTDIQNAVSLPIQYLGFIIHIPAGPRSLEFAQALELARFTKKNSAKKPVAVLQNPTTELVEKLLDSQAFDVIQLHGQETPDFCRRFYDGIEIWKVVEIQLPFEVDKMTFGQKKTNSQDFFRNESAFSGNPAEIRDQSLETNEPTLKLPNIAPYLPVVHKFLLDKPKTAASEAANEPAQNSSPPQLPREQPHPPLHLGELEEVLLPFILAGGLTPENIRQKIQDYRPWGVDTASGIEKSPGVKDPGKMAKFVQEVYKSGLNEERLWHGVCC